MKPFVFFLLIVFSVNLSAQVTRDEAVDIVISEIVAPDSVLYHHLYSRYDKMYLNDTLWLDDYYSFYYCPYEESWVFFIDDMPLAYWVHDCRIVFMDANNAEYQIIYELWPPHPFLSEHDTFMDQWEWILGTGSDMSVSKAENLSIGPNPFHNKIEVNFKHHYSKPILLQLLDSQCRIIISELADNPIKLNTEDLNAGMYILTLSCENKVFATKKLIKSD